MGNDVSGSLEALFNRMENFITTKTVVGQPTEIGGVIIVPLVDVTFGVGAGGNDKAGAEGGGIAGLGAKITPSAVLVIQNDGSVQFVNVKNQDSVSKLIDMVPGILSKLNLGSLFGKNKDKPKAEDCADKKTTVEETTEVHFEETRITEASDTDE